MPLARHSFYKNPSNQHVPAPPFHDKEGAKSVGKAVMIEPILFLVFRCKEKKAVA
jgi:hypothetical protein